MSSKATAWAWKQDLPSPLHRLVLLALGDMAGVNNDCAWPSVKYLAKMTGCSPKTVMRATSAMAEAGILAVEVRPNRSNLYTLIIEEIPQSLTVPPSPTGTMVVPHRDHGSPPQGPPQSPGVLQNLKESKKNLKRTKVDLVLAKGIDLPLALNTPDLREALTGFEAMRKAIKKPLTDHALKLIVAKLEAWGHGPALEALNNSTMSNWQGVFDPRETVNGTKAQAPTKEASVWELKSILAPIKEEARLIKLQHFADDPHASVWDNPGKRLEWIALRKQIKALEAKLRAKATQLTG